MTRTEPSNRTAREWMLTGIQSKSAFSTPTPARPGALETGSPAKRRVERQNELVSGLCIMNMEVESCMFVLETQHASTLNDTRVLVGAGCCPIMLRVRALKVQLIRSNYFFPFHKCCPQINLPSCSCSWYLAWSLHRRNGKVPCWNDAGDIWTIDTAWLSHCRTGFSLGAGAFDSIVWPSR